MNTTISYPPEGSTAQLAFTSLLAGMVLSAAYALVFLPLYYLFVSPLRAYPGPKLWAASRIPLFLSQRSGYHYTKTLELHCRYGEIVRISPTELSYVQHNAWKEIMGRKKGQVENGKDPVLYKLSRQSIVGSDYALHSQTRRILNHSFSTKSMLEQETLIQSHVDLFFERMKTKAAANEAVNIVAWYNFVTFDIIGDLAFGESFHCLDKGRFHPWVANIYNTMKSTALAYAARKLVYYVDEIFMAVNPSAVRAFKRHQNFTSSEVQKRLQISKPRPDFFEAMLTRDGGAGERLSLKSMEAISGSLAIAGSETTATVLSFTTYLLCMHPEVLARVRAEVDGAFTSEIEINFTTVGHLSYMLGVLNEAMRMFPAAAEAFVRITPPEGAVICDRPVPGNTTVGIPQWAAYHYPGNFEAATRFVPERWLPETPFPNDRKDIFNPFSYGSRDCIGKNLAYSEMRVLLARMLFCFDIELDPRSLEWSKNITCYLFWQKPDMYVHLRSRNRDAPAMVAAEATA